jgi:phenylacetate-CoA ligase
VRASEPPVPGAMELPEYEIRDPRYYTLPKAALRALQAERLRTQVRYVYATTPFWRRKFDAAGLTPDDIRGLEDLERIPFCTKAELQEDQAAHPPFGSYTASPRHRWARFMTTSGTTGRPLRRVFSARDWRYAIERFLRQPTQLRPGDVVVILGPVDGLMGPTAGMEAAMAQGALVVCAGLYDSRTKLQLIQELRPAAVSGTASYLLYLAEVARAEGVDLPALGIRQVGSVGEPGAAVPETRARLQAAWGVEHVHDGYGLTELFPLGGNCRQSTSLHLPDDLVLTEVVDPATGRRLPPGERGELVFTNLIGDTQPLLRYRSGDIGRLAPDEPCACGCTWTRIEGGIEGRVDDMIWYRGVNVFPSAVEAVVRRYAELGGEFQLVVSQQGALPTLTVRAELAAGQPLELAERLQPRLQEALRAALRVQPAVELVPHGTLPRTAGKARRVVDQRQR